MKENVLELSKEELEKLSTEELQELHDYCNDQQSFYNVQQLTQKVKINSLYGAITQKYFLFFNEAIAQAITGASRYFVKNTSNYVNNKLKDLTKNKQKEYICYNDTDSAYYTIDDIMDIAIKKKPNLSIDEYVDIADNFEKTVIDPVIQESIKDASYDLNAFKPEVIGAKREIIADVCIFIQKKKYIARIRDSEGTRYPAKDPHIKTMGVELAKSTTSRFTKEKLKQSIDIILDQDEYALNEWADAQRDDFYNSEIQDIAQNGNVSSLDYDLSKDKGIPYMCHGAIIHNKYIQENNLQDRFKYINANEKCQTIFLKLPNPLGTSRLVFNDVNFANLFKDYIDYAETFQKFFIKPIQNMVKALGYDMEKKVATFDEW